MIRDAAGRIQPMSFSSIGRISFQVADASRAAAFYRDTLGLELRFEASKAAFFDCGGVELTLEPREAAIYFRVERIGEAAAELESRGIVFERAPHLAAKMPDHELWLAFFRDPDGNRLALLEQKKRS